MKKQTDKKRPLQINLETLRALDPTELRRIAGGAPAVSNGACVTSLAC